MKKSNINKDAQVLLDMDMAFREAGVEFLNSETALVLEYLYKSTNEDINKSALKSFRSVSFDVSKYFLS